MRCAVFPLYNFVKKINEFVFGTRPTFTDASSVLRVSGMKILISYKLIYLMTHKMHLHSGAI